MGYKKKLIEVSLPLEAINAESAREKSIRHGHPSTLHLWWARRPLAAARAVIWASLVDDPSSLPEQFPTEEEQKAERDRLFGILERLVKWENSNNQDVLDEAKAEIMKSTDGKLPPLLDPFAGGGAIPLEAQRLGLEAHASDLNPVAVMINKAMVEIPPKFAGQPPVNPVSRKSNEVWTGARGLAEDVRYYGEWMKKKAYERIGHLYPKVKDENGTERTVIAWIWARTVKCPNPACGAEMPLASSFELSKKCARRGGGYAHAYVQPIVEGKGIRYEVRHGNEAPEPPKTGRGQFKCICCGGGVKPEYIRGEFQAKRNGVNLLAIVAEAQGGRLFLSPNTTQIKATQIPIPSDVPESETPYKALGINVRAYGFNLYKELFTTRQLTILTTLSSLVTDVKEEIAHNSVSKEYAIAICTYLSFIVNKIADINSTMTGWNINRDGLRNTFSMQAIQMSWDFAETNPFSNSTGCIDNAINWIVKCLYVIPASLGGYAHQADAKTNDLFENVMVSTDPPYYDNIGYADLSDFFYIWMRKSLKDSYPDLFRTMLVPKTDELVANPFKFDGSRDTARHFFEGGMLETFKKINRYAYDSIPVTVYYAFKQSDEDENCNAASTGWETMLSAIVQAGFSITGTWPLRTERATRSRSVDSNALASSIVLVCRKRPSDAPATTRRDFIAALKRELRPALQKLQASNIAPVDLAQSAIGPGMGVYSRFSNVLEADGTPMGVRQALQVINQELDLYFTEQDGELDRDSRFCVDLYTQYAFNDVKFGEADVLARAKNTSVEKLAARGILHAQKGVVRLLARDEISQEVEIREPVIWLLAQQLTRAIEKDGVVGAAKIVANFLTSEPDQAKALAYHMFTIADRKGWAGEAFAYNSLVISWPDVQSKAADMKGAGPKAAKQTRKQKNLFDSDSDQTPLFDSSDEP